MVQIQCTCTCSSNVGVVLTDQCPWRGMSTARPYIVNTVTGKIRTDQSKETHSADFLILQCFPVYTTSSYDYVYDVMKERE